jgi:hypothetical protein
MAASQTITKRAVTIMPQKIRLLIVGTQVSQFDGCRVVVLNVVAFAVGCVFHPLLDSDSTTIWTAIP